MQFGLSGPHDCHVYALRVPGGLALIDCGAGTHMDRIVDHISSEYPNCPVLALLITHAHLDHCGGAALTKLRYGCEVIAPELSRTVLQDADEERSGLRTARDQGVYPAGFRMQPCTLDRVVQDGDRFLVAGQEFTAIHVRGHSRDAFCYEAQTDLGTILFSGDVVFYGGVLGVINADGSGMEGYRADLHKLEGRDIHGLFPGHGMFTVSQGQRHVNMAIEQLRSGFLPRQIGQGDLLF
ncbi:MAG TPA: MBL fold metallo-hydrolase [Terriglobales bacterium]|nr:MBL fold metallo-hydrolase [Terriglobales bacterium]